MESIDTKAQAKLDKRYTQECLQHQILALPVPFECGEPLFKKLAESENVVLENTFGMYS